MPPPGAEELDALIQAAGIIDKRYVLCRTVKPLAGQTWEGGGRLESCQAPVTYLTRDAQAGDTTIHVASGAPVASGTAFEPNHHRLAFGLGGRASAIELAPGCRHHWVANSTKTTITFSNGLCGDHPAMTPVFPILVLVSVDVDGVTLRNITIDGRESIQPAYHAWGEATNLLTNWANDLLVEDVAIVNAWSDGILFLNSDRLTLQGVTIENTRCAGAHWGNVDDLVIENSTIRSTGTHAAECGHTEGGLTISNNNFNVEIRDSCFEDIQAAWGPAAVGSMGMSKNAGFRMERNQVCGAPHLFSAYYNPTEASPVFPAGQVEIYDNTAYVERGLFYQQLGALDVDPRDYPDLIDFTESGNLELAAPCSCPSAPGAGDSLP
jgi:hypothetical protein